MAMNMPSGPVIDRDLQHEIEQFLYREARLLDERRFHEWLDLLTDDVFYWMPVRETNQQRPEGFYQEGELAVSYMNDNKDFLTARIKRLDTGQAHAETPPSRTRHLITNVEIELDRGQGPLPGGGRRGRQPREDLQPDFPLRLQALPGPPRPQALLAEITVHSNFMLFQSRREHSDYFFMGKREDRLRRVDGEWKIARRKVFLDHAILPRGPSVLF